MKRWPSAFPIVTLLTLALLSAGLWIGSKAYAMQRPSPTPAATPPCGPGVDIRNVARDSRCFELRTYTLQPGNSADVLHARTRS